MLKLSKDFYTVNNIADMLQVNPFTVRRWIREGHLKAVKFQRLVRIEKEELRRYLRKSGVNI